MVFVLLLTSVAVIEYLLRREHTGAKKGPSVKQAAPQKAELRPTDAGSLLSLADAIERQGLASGAGPAERQKPGHKVTETPR